MVMKKMNNRHGASTVLNSERRVSEGEIGEVAGLGDMAGKCPEQSDVWRRLPSPKEEGGDGESDQSNNAHYGILYRIEDEEPDRRNDLAIEDVQSLSGARFLLEEIDFVGSFRERHVRANAEKLESPSGEQARKCEEEKKEYKVKMGRQKSPPSSFRRSSKESQVGRNLGGHGGDTRSDSRGLIEDEVIDADIESG